MSSIEDRIVRMRFENADFEQRVEKTMSTLDKLKAKLRFRDSSDDVRKLQSDMNNLSFSPLLKGIESIEHRFSAVGIAGATLVHNLTNSAINAAKSLEQATIGQIKAGGWSRAMNIANAQFQIEGLGYAWEKVEKAVSYGVKDTAYGLDAAAAAASQLAASGVDFQKVIKTVNGQQLTQMHKSLRAISGVAAMTNSSYEDIARIFTTVAGNGRLMGDQLLQLSGRGMNAAATLAKTLKKTEAQVRDMVSRGKIDYITFANAMDDAFGDHAKEANKTFTGALSNMKAALSRFGAVFATPIINKTNTFFIAITKRIDEMKASISDLDEKTPRFATHFAEAWQAGVDAMSALVAKIDLDWFDRLAQRADKAAEKVRDFFNAVKEYIGDASEEAAKSVGKATKIMSVSAEEAEAAKKVIAGVYGNGKTRRNKLIAEYGEEAANNIQAYVNAVVAAGWSYEKASIKIRDASDTVVESEEKVAKNTRLFKIFDAWKKTFKNIGTIISNVFTSIKKITGSIWSAFKKTFNISALGISEGIASLSDMLVKFSEKLVISDGTAKKIEDVFVVIFTFLKNAISNLKKLGTKLYNTAEEFLNGDKMLKIKKWFSDVVDWFIGLKDKDITVPEKLKKLVEKIGDFFKSFSNIEADPDNVGLIQLTLDKFVNAVKGKVQEMSNDDVLGVARTIAIGVMIFRFFDKLRTLGTMMQAIEKVPEKINAVLGSIANMFRYGGYALRRVSIAYMIITVAKAIGYVAASLLVLSLIDTQRLYDATAVIIAIGGVMAALIKVTSVISGFGRGLISFSIRFSLVTGIIMTIVALAVGISVVIDAFIELNKIMSDNSVSAVNARMDAIKHFFIILGSVLLTIILVVAVVAYIVSKNPIGGSLWGVAVLMISLAASMKILAGALEALGKIKMGNIGGALAAIGVFVAAVVLITYISSVANAGSILATCLLMVTLAGAFLVLTVAISALAIVARLAKTDNFLDAVLAVGSVIMALGAAALLAKSAEGKGAAEILMLAGALTLLLLSLKSVLGGLNEKQLEALIKIVNALSTLAKTLAIAAVVFTVLKAVLSRFAHSMDNSGAIIEMSLAFVTVAVSLYVFAKAIETLSNVSGSIWTTMAAFGLFIGIIVLLATVSNKFLHLEKTLLYIGAGFALIGVGLLATAAAAKVFSSALPMLIAYLGSFLGVVEEHAEGVLLLVAFAAVIALLAYALGKLLAPILTLVVSIVKPALEAIGSFLKTSTEKFTNWVKNLSARGKILFTGVILAICGALLTASPEILKTIGDLFIKLLDHLGKIAGPIAEGIVVFLIDVLNGVSDAIRNNSSSIWNALLNIVTSLGALIIDLIWDLTEVASPLSQIGGKLLEAIFGETVGKELTVALHVGQSAKNKKEREEWTKNLTEGLEILKKNAKERDDIRHGVVDSIKAETDASKNSATEQKKTFGEMILSWLGLKKASDETTKSIVSNYDHLPQAAKDVMVKAGAFDYNTGYTVGSDTGSGVLDGFASAITGGNMEFDLSGIKKQLTDAASKYGISMDDVFPDGMSGDLSNMFSFNAEGLLDANSMAEIEKIFSGAGDTAGTSFTDEFGNTTGSFNQEAYDKGKALADSTSQGVSDAQPEMNQATSNMLAGITQAMIHYQNTTGPEQMRNVCQAMLDEYTKFNLIASPSKLYAEKTGFLLQGITDTLRNGRDSAGRSMSDLSEIMVVSFGDPLSEVAKRVSGEIPIDTKIRPVVDMSTASSSSRAINTMFNGQQVSLSGFSGKLSADLGQISSNNSDIVAELVALRTDMQDMTERIESMQIVMDSGALVGSIAGDMDSALGRRSVYKRRGN